MTDDPIVGRVLRADTRGFACGTHSTQIGYIHDFGTFVKAPVANSRSGAQVIGLIYKVDIQDDKLVSELVMGENVAANVLRDQRHNRMIPVEIAVLNVGYMVGDDMRHSLPPRPPMSLDVVVRCTAEEIDQFTRRFDFFRLVLNASDVPADALLGAALRQAAAIYNERESYDFLIHCGRELARQLSNDVKRLSHVLALIRP